MARLWFTSTRKVPSGRLLDPHRKAEGEAGAPRSSRIPTLIRAALLYALALYLLENWPPR